MASSVTDTSNKQGGKKGKYKNKDLVVLVDERAAEINNSMGTLMGMVDDMEKHLEELESMGDFEEFRGEVQAAVNFVVVDVNKEVQALRTSEAAHEEELKDCRIEIEAYKTKVEALEAQLKVCIAAVASMGVSGPSQLSTTSKGNALQTPIYNGARNARKIDNFFWKLEAYFEAVGIMHEVQKVNTASFSLGDIALAWWRCMCDHIN